MKKYILIAALVWVSETFTGPRAQWDYMELLNSLPVDRAKEAKVVQGLVPEQYGLGITYTVIYRDKPLTEDK